MLTEAVRLMGVVSGDAQPARRREIAPDPEPRSMRAPAPVEDRPKLKGIKAELLTIKGALIKANQKKHEYVAQMEEAEQMKRLGISTS